MPTYTGICLWRDLTSTLTSRLSSADWTMVSNQSGTFTFTSQGLTITGTVTTSGLSISNLTNETLPPSISKRDLLIRPYNASIANSWLIQYLFRVEVDHLIIALQGIYQLDPSARTAIGYLGRLEGNPSSNVMASTSGYYTPAGIVSTHTQRCSSPDLYSAQLMTLATSPNFDQDYLLSKIGAYRADEGMVGTFQNVYACQIQAGSLLNGETVTAQDGTRYTFFNVPTSQDGYYNAFVNQNVWLTIPN